MHLTRRAYGFTVGLALAVGLTAWIASMVLDMPIRDPDGFAGPSYIRLPLIVFVFYLLDVVPRVLKANSGFSNFWSSFKEYTRQRWTPSRMALVFVGLTSFYVVYVAYRNIKGFLPFVREGVLQDQLLSELDRALMFGNSPADLLHTVLGTGISAHILSLVYTAFLVFVPVTLGAALVWSKNVTTGFWYVTALCVNWVLGAASYYWLPSLGPFYSEHSQFADLPYTGVTVLQDALVEGRDMVLMDPAAASEVQGVAAFASLHVSIIFTAALICHYVIPNRWVRRGMWVFFVLTTISTIYFGWHYLLDDVAGLGIGYLAVWIGARTTGHRMQVQRHPAGESDGVVGVFPPDSSGPADKRDGDAAPEGRSQGRHGTTADGATDGRTDRGTSDRDAADRGTADRETADQETESGNRADARR